MANENDLTKRTLTLKRTFDAPVELVWEAWTKAEHVAQWWAPKMMKLTVVEHNFKVGGSWKYVMAMPDGTQCPSSHKEYKLAQEKLGFYNGWATVFDRLNEFVKEV